MAAQPWAKPVAHLPTSTAPHHQKPFRFNSTSLHFNPSRPCRSWPPLTLSGQPSTHVMLSQIRTHTRSSTNTLPLSSRPTRCFSSTYVMSSQPSGLKMLSNRS